MHTDNSAPADPFATNIIPMRGLVLASRPQTLEEVCARHNLAPPVNQWPGAEYRLDDPEKTGQGDGWLYLFADGAGGAIQNHRLDDKHETFFYAGGDVKPTDEQKRELRRMRERAKERTTYEQRVAAVECQTIWFHRTWPADPAHPYLTRKRIGFAAEDLRMIWQLPPEAPAVLRYLKLPLVVVPISSMSDEIVSLEYIDAEGVKRYHTDGAKDEGYAVLNGGAWSRPGPVYLAEGMSTAASIAFATARPCVAALDAGNLPKVAKGMRLRFPTLNLVICADDDIRLDREKKPNKGRVKAEEAARHGGARIAVPDFSKLPDRGTWSDFNDVHTLLGEWEVRQQVEAAIKPSVEAWWLDDPLPELVMAQTYGETDLAEAFARLRAGDMRYLIARRKWLMYEGGAWREQALTQAYGAIAALCRHGIAIGIEGKAKGCSLRAARTHEAIERHASKLPAMVVTPDQFDTDPWAFNTPGGVVDLRAGTLLDHRPDQFLMNQANVAPGGECPTFRTFLHQVFKDQAGVIDYLQRLFGYALTGITDEQILSFFHGGGGNGKGTLLDSIKYVWGPGYYAATTSDTFTKNHNQQHLTFLATLKDARLVTAQEVEQGKVWNEKRVTELTGQDTITANFMRCDPFTFVPNFKLIVAGNSKPKFSTVNEAIRRRLQLVPFERSFQGEARDNDLRAKLQAEAGGILAWAIEGCALWQRHGLQPPATVISATTEYLDSEDLEAQWLEERCVRHQWSTVKLSDLFSSWKSFAEQHGADSKRDQDLAARLVSEGFIKTADSYKKTSFRGIQMVAPADAFVTRR